MCDDSRNELKATMGNQTDNDDSMRGYQLKDMTMFVDPQKSLIILKFRADQDCPDPLSFLSVGGLDNERTEKSQQIEILSTEQVAEELGMSTKTVRKLIGEGFLEALPGIRPYKITRKALDRYLRGHSAGDDSVVLPSVTGQRVTPVEKSVRRLLAGSVARSQASREDELQQADEEMKSWGD